MFDARQDLTPAAVDLLLTIAEMPRAAIAGAILMDHYGAVAPALLERGLLTAGGDEPTTTSMADHDDVPVTVTWSPEHRAVGYFSPTAGWVVVPTDRLSSYVLAFDKLLPCMLAPLFASKHRSVVPLLPDLLWEVGEVQLPGRAKPVPLWVGRRFGDAGVWSQFVGLTHTRAAPGLRIVLSFTPGARIPTEILNGHAIISVKDVARHADGLMIDPDLLAARVASGGRSTDALITVAAEGAAVTVRGKRYKFTGSKQRAIIRQLYESWESGEPERLTTEVLEIAGYRDSVNTLGKAFSGNRDWKTFIGEGRGYCWMFA